MKLQDLKDQNEAPEWLEESGFKTLSNGYLLPNETPRQMWQRVSNSSAKYLNKPELAEKFFDLFWKGWLCGATPVLSNSGANRGLNISCYAYHSDDTTNNLLQKGHELAMLSKHGGGVGIYMGDVRPSGSPISTGGTSEGTIPFIKIYDSIASGISQGSVRRGAAAVYLPATHGDAEAFLRIRRPEGDPNRQCLNIHHALSVSDEFMEGAISGSNPKYRHLLVEAYKTRLETGEPYFFFHDNVQQNRPQCYKENNLTISTSNICLAGDTLVATSEGPQKIKDLVDKEVEIFDGENWVLNNSFKKTGINQKLLRIHLSDGSFVDSTLEHRWFVVVNESIEEILAKELAPHMWLETYKGLSQFVRSIEEIPSADVYCTTVPTTSKFALANGLMTGNCNEIFLYTDPDHTFVCCLSSMNLAKWEEWKNTDAVYYATWFLEGVLTEFIDKAKHIHGFECAVRFSEKSRALGLGVLGWHSLLQAEMTSIDSLRAKLLNKAIFMHMKENALRASQDMAKEYGEPEWCKGYGVRNSHLLAVAPTASNSTISGNVSPGIEPINSNAFTKRTAKGTFLEYNPLLKKLLQEKGKDVPEVWKTIIADAGSVRKLDFLSDEEKDVFKTAFEIDQNVLVNLASDRQKYICQGQSLNLFFSANVDPQYFHEVHVNAWKKKLNGLYYVRSSSVLRSELASKGDDNAECKACEG